MEKADNHKENSMRQATVTRESTETSIKVELNLDGTGKTAIATGFGMADHMLTLLAFWAGFDLKIQCKGDMHIDAHHTVEDIAMCFGQALLEALGDRKCIARVGNAKVPMDEALVEVCLDISGRAWLEWRDNNLLPPVIAGEETDLWREMWKSFTVAAKMNTHVIFHYGKNGHHMIESAAKSTGLALRQAILCNRNSVMSTKGRLDG